MGCGHYPGPCASQVDGSKYVQAELKKAFPGRLSYGGTTGVCRTITGSSSFSQHSWGNAIDLSPSPYLSKSPKSLRWDWLDPVAAWLYKNRQALGIHGLLWRGKSMISGYPVDGHDDHIHVSFYPYGSGKPWCAEPWGQSNKWVYSSKFGNKVEYRLKPSHAEHEGALQEPNTLPLRRGDSGTLVEHYQNRMLIWDPEALPAYRADGDFGRETEEWVKIFEGRWGLSPSGIIDQTLADLLDGRPPAPQPPVVQPPPVVVPPPVVIPPPIVTPPVVIQPPPLPEYDAGFEGAYRKFFYPLKGKNDESAERSNQSALEDYLNKQGDYTQAQIDEIVVYLRGLSAQTSQQMGQMHHDITGVVHRGSLWTHTPHMPPPHAPHDGWREGDQCLEETTGELFLFTGGKWNDEGFSIMGPEGPRGPMGPRGAHGFVGLRGSIWSTTTTMPPDHAPPDGWKPGDVIMHTTDGELFHHTATGWTDDGVSILGPEGPRGIQGIQGTIGLRGSVWSHTATMPPTHAPAGGWLEGDQILHEGDGELFLYKNGTWVDEGVSILGPEGPTGPTGAQGSRGEPGVIGHEGPAGHIGPVGHVGPEGPSGADGTGIDIKGAVAAVTDLPSLAHGHTHHGVAYIVTATGDLYTPITPVGGGPDAWTDVGHVQGPQGIRGAPGPAGHQGVQGLKGDTGTGAQGVQGDPGVQGPKGDDGTAGLLGPVGPQGTTGIAGPKGATGTPGTHGDPGVHGTHGDPGIQGSAGAQGVRGEKGEQGDQGVHGDPGTHGSPGAAGATGGVGPEGPEGHIGPAGHSIHILSVVATPADLPTNLHHGHDGDAHLVKSTGDLMIWSDHDQTWHDLGHVAGPAGPRGVKGEAGVHGTHGDKGDPGLPGAKGDTGLQGVIGPDGPQGDAGTDGAAGTPGTPGLAGAKGDTGGIGHTGPAGAQGAHGTAGSTGAQGPKGDPGSRGATGAVSVTPGPAGPKGVTGDKGDAGHEGHVGAVGPHGGIGPKGATGAQGAKGHSIHILSVVATPSALPTGLTADHDGDAHLVRSTGDLMVWSDHDKSWVDMGHVQGPQGPIGHTGGAGPVGAKGGQGVRGPAGGVGSAGAKGDPGVIGHAGARGLPGAPGVTGAAGPRGIHGTPGATGGKGDTGTQGPTGAAGSIGPIGHTGLRGSVWTHFAGPPPDSHDHAPPGGWLPGDQWLDETTGHVWNCTVKGDPGTWAEEGVSLKGTEGPIGAAGPRGAHGLPGAKGATGAKSTVVGPRGPAGPKGATGSISDAHGDARYLRLSGGTLTGDLHLRSSFHITPTSEFPIGPKSYVLVYDSSTQQVSRDYASHYLNSDHPTFHYINLTALTATSVQPNLFVHANHKVYKSSWKGLPITGGTLTGATLLGKLQVRNIWLTTATPSHPHQGDIWMKP